jgi:hypothetical protein
VAALDLRDGFVLLPMDFTKGAAQSASLAVFAESSAELTLLTTNYDHFVEQVMSKEHVVPSTLKEAIATRSAQGHCNASRFSARSAETETADPPKLAGFLLRLCASRGEAEAVVGCMHERFERDRAKYGVGRARLYCWADTGRSLWPLLRLAASRLVK